MEIGVVDKTCAEIERRNGYSVHFPAGILAKMM
jgi:hypothetical protein